MPNRLLRHFNIVGVAVYLVALLVASLCFRTYALKALWMAWGVAAVLFFFGLSDVFYQRWRDDSTKVFLRKVFWVALGIRAVYATAILYYYYYQTGIGMEYQVGDSLNYHRGAAYIADLARDGHFSEIFLFLKNTTMGFSDQGYVLYLGTLYTVFGKNILGPRLLKALMSAAMCVSIYRLASRSLGERTGKLAAVMAVFLPQFIHYTGTYMKETEMVFLATLALERMDFLIRSKRYTFWNVLSPILLTALTFGFRTIVGMILIVSFVIFVMLDAELALSKRNKAIMLGLVAVVTAVFFFTPIGGEMRLIFRVNFHESNYLTEKYQYLGLKYAEYARHEYLAPGAFTLPLTNLVEVANENQKLMNGTYFVKNHLAFFALWCIVAALRERRWRSFSLVGSYTLIYIVTIALSFACMSERYHLPALPGMLIMAAFAMTHFRKKDFAFFYSYETLLLVAIVAWNYLKLSARGLIF